MILTQLIWDILADSPYRQEQRAIRSHSRTRWTWTKAGLRLIIEMIPLECQDLDGASANARLLCANRLADLDSVATFSAVTGQELQCGGRVRSFQEEQRMSNQIRQRVAPGAVDEARRQGRPR